jgi:hypothetical protein
MNDFPSAHVWAAGPRLRVTRARFIRRLAAILAAAPGLGRATGGVAAKCGKKSARCDRGNQ